MYKKILIALDGSEISVRGLDAGVSLARALDASVILVMVTAPLASFVPGEMALGISIDDYEESSAKWAERILLTSTARAEATGVRSTSHHIANAYPAEAIVAKAIETDADLIVVAPHPRTAASWFLFGSETSRVVAGSKQSILIVR